MRGAVSGFPRVVISTMLTIDFRADSSDSLAANDWKCYWRMARSVCFINY